MKYEHLIPKHKKRQNIYLRFFTIFDNYNNKYLYNYSNDDLHKMALNIERGIFNYAIKHYQYNTKRIILKCWNFVFEIHYYLQKASSIYYNLKEDNNTFLIKSLFDRVYSEFDIMNLDYKERDPIFWKTVSENTKLDNMKFVPKEEIPANGLFTCFKCKSTQTTYYQIQQRACDESPSTYVRCVCGNRWKFN